MADLLLLGDLGGTNVRFSVHQLPETGACKSLTPPLLQARYHVVDFDSLERMVLAFLTEIDATTTLSSLQIQGLSLSVCGPVTNGSAILLAAAFGEKGWRISEAAVAKATGLQSVKFVNDFHAVGLAITSVPPSDRICLYEPGNADLTESEDRWMGGIAVLGPGTGLGECYGVATDNTSLSISCSEGGMSDFVPRNEQVSFQSSTGLVDTLFGSSLLQCPCLLCIPLRLMPAIVWFRRNGD